MAAIKEIPIHMERSHNRRKTVAIMRRMRGSTIFIYPLDPALRSPIIGEFSGISEVIFCPLLVTVHSSRYTVTFLYSHFLLGIVFH